MYESKGQPLLPRLQFIRRLMLHIVAALTLTAASLFIGVAAFIHLEGHDWDQAFLNTSMMLGGIGPADLPTTVEGRLFVGFYSIYAGLVFVAAVGVTLAPVVHRFLHRFHWHDDASRTSGTTQSSQRHAGDSASRRR